LNNFSDTKLAINTGWKVSSPYITSESPKSVWLQPSLSHYIVVIEGAIMRGYLIEDIYPTVANSRPEPTGAIVDLNMELAAWDAAADEDFLDFESRLE
jgi:hypothetical protein